MSKEKNLLIATILLGVMFPISCFGLSMISESFIIIGLYCGISSLLCGTILIDLKSGKQSNLILIGIIMIFFSLLFLGISDFYQVIRIPLSILYAIAGLCVLVKGIFLYFQKGKAKTTKTPSNESDLKKYKTKIEEYNRFLSQVYLCVSDNTFHNKTRYICIHKKTKELFVFSAKTIEHQGTFKQYYFAKQPQKITTYSKLLNCLRPKSKKMFSDLDEFNWKEYFNFMLLPPDHSGEILRKQLLSCDCGIVRKAVFAVHDLVLKPPEERKMFLSDAYQNISLIKKNLDNLDMGGMLVSLNRFADRAIQIIEGNNTENCFCRLLIDEFGPSANGLAKEGFLLIQKDKKINDYSVRGIIECPICHKKYSIVEEYTGWHISTTIHCTEISDA